jgi:ComF family protein
MTPCKTRILEYRLVGFNQVILYLLTNNEVNISRLMPKGVLKDFFNLFYPPLCTVCSKVLVKQEKHICLSCICHLPKTNFHLDNDNPMEQLFWGRVNIVAAAALYYFEKGSKSRRILHQIKYTGHRELARYLGNLYGSELSLSGRFTDPDLLIPVPLHHSRKLKRGYNQSEWFAMGLATGLGKKVNCDILIRYLSTETQTNKTRIQRWENVENCFRVRDPGKIENKHILLVDDVVTTGATLESCATALLDTSGVRVSILTMAYA